MAPSTPPSNDTTPDPRSSSDGGLLPVPEEHKAWLCHVGDLDAEDNDDADWLIPGKIARGEHHQLVAPPKEGKTIVALANVVALAAGRSFADWPAPPVCTPVFLIEEEGRRADVQRQLARLGHGMGVDIRKLPIYIAHRRNVRLDDPAWVRRVCAAIRDLQPGLIVLDHLSAMHRLDENPAAEMGRLLDALHSFREVTDHRLRRPSEDADRSVVRTAVLLLHHARKEVAASSTHQGRGSSALPAAADAIWGIRSRKDDAGNLEHIDVQFSGRRPMEPLALRVEETETTLRLVADDAALGVRENAGSGKGQADILSQVLTYLNAAGPTLRKDIPAAIGRNKKAVLDCIRAAVTDGTLTVVERDGREFIGNKVVPIPVRTETSKQGEMKS